MSSISSSNRISHIAPSWQPSHLKPILLWFERGVKEAIYILAANGELSTLGFKIFFMQLRVEKIVLR